MAELRHILIILCVIYLQQMRYEYIIKDKDNTKEIVKAMSYKKLLKKLSIKYKNKIVQIKYTNKKNNELIKLVKIKEVD